MNNPSPDGIARPLPRPPRKRARLVSGKTVRRMMRGWLLAGAVAVAGWETVEAAAQTAEKEHSSVRSADLHFRVSGLSSEENLRWLERLSVQEKALEKWVGKEVPFGRDQGIGVSFRTRADAAEPVVRVQGWEEGRFIQRLAAPGAWGLDNEDFAEAACWLLLNRLAADETPPEMRFGMGAETPDWLACGVAQATAPALRVRNREWVARELREGRAMRLAEIVKMERMPAGRWREKAYAGAAVEFLLPSGAAECWQEVFSALGRREALSAIWLREHCPALAGKNPENEWRAWLARLASAEAAERQEDRSLRQESLLMDLLAVHPRDWVPDVPDGVPEEVFARDLAAWRNQPWCRTLAEGLLTRTKELAVASPPMLREAAGAYAAYFAQLATPPKAKTHWWQRSDESGTELPRPPDDATWALALNQLWQRAERLHQQFLETTLARRQYVDGWDVRTRDDERIYGKSTEDEEPRTALQRYLDTIEDVF